MPIIILKLFHVFCCWIDSSTYELYVRQVVESIFFRLIHVVMKISFLTETVNIDYRVCCLKDVHDVDAGSIHSVVEL